MAFSWTKDTTPFTADATGTVPARFVLEQIGDREFRLVESFRYRTESGFSITVTPARLGSTDLASVPLPLAWFVRSAGRHTPAALVHDQRVFPGMESRDRVAADREFRDATDALDVPPVRSRVMWSAVTVATRAHMRPWGLAGLVLWALASLLGTIMLVVGIATATPVMVVAALAAPLVAAGLWGRQYWAGVIGGYAVWLVAVPALTSVGMFYVAYWPIEQLVRLGRRIGRFFSDAPPSSRSASIPGPTSYKQA